MGYFHRLQGLDAFFPLLLPHRTQMRAAKNSMNSVFIHPLHGKVEGIDDTGMGTTQNDEESIFRRNDDRQIILKRILHQPLRFPDDLMSPLSHRRSAGVLGLS